MVCVHIINETHFILRLFSNNYFQKRQLALRSGPFNLKDKIFCELFPDTVEVSTKQQPSGQNLTRSTYVVYAMHFNKEQCYWV